jgi:hypothetical protein
MKPKLRGWKEGIIIEDLRSMGGFTHRKGSTVRYKRHKEYDSKSFWTGKYQWYYLDTDNTNLVRSGELLIDENAQL